MGALDKREAEEGEPCGERTLQVAHHSCSLGIKYPLRTTWERTFPTCHWVRAKVFIVVFEAGQKFTTDLESSTPSANFFANHAFPTHTYSSKPSTLALTGITQHGPSPELLLLKTFSLVRAA